jgi:hypothetical protein
MTTYFVSSVDGNNADDGLSWANAKQTIAGALAVPVVAGDIVLVDSAHAFVATAAITWTPVTGNIAIISVNRAGGDAWLAGASESVGAASNFFRIANIGGSALYVYGMTLNAGTNASSACDIDLLISGSATTFSKLTLDTCTLDLKAADANAQIVLGIASTGGAQRSSRIKMINSTIIVSGSRAGTAIALQSSECEFINPTFSMTGATKPAALFGVMAINETGSIRVRDGDVTGYAVASSAYVSVTNAAQARVIFENLKLSSAPTIISGTWPIGRGSITLRNCDSGDTTYTFQYITHCGTLTAENTDYVTTGGAQFNGAPIAWKIITTAACNEGLPFVLPPLSEWNTSTGAQTAAIEIAQVNGAAALTNRQIWSDLDFPASASFPNYTYQTNRNANPFTGTGAAHATSTNPWTVPNIGASPVLQKLENAFTAAETGLLKSEISVGIASTTLWLNPALDGLTDSSGTQTVWSVDGAFTKKVSASGGGVMGARIFTGM